WTHAPRCTPGPNTSSAGSSGTTASMSCSLLKFLILSTSTCGPTWMSSSQITTFQLKRSAASSSTAAVRRCLRRWRRASSFLHMHLRLRGPVFARLAISRLPRCSPSWKTICSISRASRANIACWQRWARHSAQSSFCCSGSPGPNHALDLMARGIIRMRFIAGLLGHRLRQRVLNAGVRCSRWPEREVGVVLTATQHGVLFCMRFRLRARAHILLHKGEGIRQRDTSVLLLKGLHKVVGKVAVLNGVALERLLIDSACRKDYAAASLANVLKCRRSNRTRRDTRRHELLNRRILNQPVAQFNLGWRRIFVRIATCLRNVAGSRCHRMEDAGDTRVCRPIRSDIELAVVV